MEKITFTAIGDRKHEISIEVVGDKNEINALIERLRKITGDSVSTHFRVTITAAHILKIIESSEIGEILSLVGVPEGLHAFHTRCLSYFGSGKKQQGQEALINLYKYYNISSPDSLKNMILDQQSYDLYNDIKGLSHGSMTWLILALMQENSNNTGKFPEDIQTYIPSIEFGDSSISENIREVIYLGYPRKRNNDILRILLGKGIKIKQEQLVTKRRVNLDISEGTSRE